MDKVIEWKTGGPFVHVELILSGPISNALCFSSRQPNGTSFAHLDLLDDKIWEVEMLPLRSTQEEDLMAFCAGCGSKSYDWMGILGFVLPFGEHDDHDRFCSEICTEALQKILGCWPEVKPWNTSPMGLYELVIKRGITA